MSIARIRSEMIARKSYRSAKRKRRHSAGNVALVQVGYRYDCFDRRISKTVDTDPANVAVNSSPTTFYVYDGVNVRMEFTKSDGIAGGAPAALSVRYFNGQGVDNVIAQENYSPQAVPGQIGSTYWLIKDQVGSTTDVLNANGQQVNHIDYTTFGQFQILDPNTGTYTLSSTPPPGTVTTHLFTGREFDAETGNYYYRARNYNSGIGRFNGEDPLGMSSGFNQYDYAGNDPVNYSDPMGLEKRGYAQPPQPRYGEYERSGPLQGFVSASSIAGSCPASGGIDWNLSGALGPMQDYFNEFFGSTEFSSGLQSVEAGTGAVASQLKEYLRAFSGGYGPDRYNLLHTVDTGRADIGLFVALGGISYTLTPLLTAKSTSIGWSYPAEEAVEFSHWIPYRYLRDVNTWLNNKFNWLGNIPGIQIRNYSDYYDRSKSILGKTSFWNGNNVNAAVHAMTDPAVFVRGNPPIEPFRHDLNMILRLPTWLQGELLGLWNRWVVNGDK